MRKKDEEHVNLYGRHYVYENGFQCGEIRNSLRKQPCPPTHSRSQRKQGPHRRLSDQGPRVYHAKSAVIRSTYEPSSRPTQTKRPYTAKAVRRTRIVNGGLNKSQRSRSSSPKEQHILPLSLPNSCLNSPRDRGGRGLVVVPFLSVGSERVSLPRPAFSNLPASDGEAFLTPPDSPASGRSIPSPSPELQQALQQIEHIFQYFQETDNQLMTILDMETLKVMSREELRVRVMQIHQLHEEWGQSLGSVRQLYQEMKQDNKRLREILVDMSEENSSLRSHKEEAKDFLKKAKIEIEGKQNQELKLKERIQHLEEEKSHMLSEIQEFKVSVKQIGEHSFKRQQDHDHQVQTLQKQLLDQAMELASARNLADQAMKNAELTHSKAKEQHWEWEETNNTVIATLKDQLDSAKSELAQAKEGLKAKDNYVNDLIRKVKGATDEKIKITHQINELKSELEMKERCQTELNEFKQHNSTLKEQIEAKDMAIAELEGLKERLCAKDQSSEVDQIKNDLQVSLAQLNAMTEKLDHKEATLEVANQRAIAASTTIQDLESSMSSAKTRIGELEVALGTKEKDLAAAQQEVVGVRSEVTRLEDVLAKGTDSEVLKQEMQTLQARIVDHESKEKNLNMKVNELEEQKVSLTANSINVKKKLTEQRLACLFASHLAHTSLQRVEEFQQRMLELLKVFAIKRAIAIDEWKKMTDGRLKAEAELEEAQRQIEATLGSTSEHDLIISKKELEPQNNPADIGAPNKSDKAAMHGSESATNTKEESLSEPPGNESQRNKSEEGSESNEAQAKESTHDEGRPGRIRRGSFKDKFRRLSLNKAITYDELAVSVQPQEMDSDTFRNKVIYPQLDPDAEYITISFPPGPLRMLVGSRREALRRLYPNAPKLGPEHRHAEQQVIVVGFTQDGKKAGPVEADGRVFIGSSIVKVGSKRTRQISIVDILYLLRSGQHKKRKLTFQLPPESERRRFMRIQEFRLHESHSSDQRSGKELWKEVKSVVVGYSIVGYMTNWPARRKFQRKISQWQLVLEPGSKEEKAVIKIQTVIRMFIARRILDFKIYRAALDISATIIQNAYLDWKKRKLEAQVLETSTNSNGTIKPNLNPMSNLIVSTSQRKFSGSKKSLKATKPVTPRGQPGNASGAVISASPRGSPRGSPRIGAKPRSTRHLPRETSIMMDQIDEHKETNLDMLSPGSSPRMLSDLEEPVSISTRILDLGLDDVLSPSNSLSKKQPTKDSSPPVRRNSFTRMGSARRRNSIESLMSIRSRRASLDSFLFPSMSSSDSDSDEDSQDGITPSEDQEEDESTGKQSSKRSRSRRPSSAIRKDSSKNSVLSDMSYDMLLSPETSDNDEEKDS